MTSCDLNEEKPTVCITPEYAVIFNNVSDSVSDMDYVKAVSSIIGSINIHSVFRNGFHIKVYVTEKKYLAAIMKSGVLFKRQTLNVEFAIPPAAKIVISKVDPIIPDSCILDLLSTYGSFKSGVIHQTLSNDIEFAHVRSDVRHVYMEINKDVTIPSTCSLLFNSSVSEIEISVEKSLNLCPRSVLPINNGSTDFMESNTNDTEESSGSDVEFLKEMFSATIKAKVKSSQKLEKNVIKLDSPGTYPCKKRVTKGISTKSKRLCKRGKNSNQGIANIVCRVADDNVLSPIDSKQSLVDAKQTSESTKKTFTTNNMDLQKCSSNKSIVELCNKNSKTKNITGSCIKIKKTCSNLNANVSTHIEPCSENQKANQCVQEEVSKENINVSTHIEPCSENQKANQCVQEEVSKENIKKQISSIGKKLSSSQQNSNQGVANIGIEEKHTDEESDGLLSDIEVNDPKHKELIGSVSQSIEENLQHIVNEVNERVILVTDLMPSTNSCNLSLVKKEPEHKPWSNAKLESQNVRDQDQSLKADYFEKNEIVKTNLNPASNFPKCQMPVIDLSRDRMTCEQSGVITLVPRAKNEGHPFYNIETIIVSSVEITS